ncbi:MAG: phosphoglucomutase [Treponemataceae bacterium]|nr:phosphoglucomutase [Treponemataceae bacterium]
MIFFNKTKNDSNIRSFEIENLLKEKTASFEEVQNALESTILSASGWRRVFAESKDQQDKTSCIGKTNAVLAALMAQSFAAFIKQKSNKLSPVVAVGTDTRPTGASIADAMIRVLLKNNITIQYLGIAAAPEIMAYSHKVDGFVYISASHNPIGHNGVKFGLNDGGVIAAKDANALADDFRKLCADQNCAEKAKELCTFSSSTKIDAVYKNSGKFKAKAIEAYKAFTKQVISDKTEKSEQNRFFETIKTNCKTTPITVVADMNGSARTISIDKAFFSKLGINIHAINDKPGCIVHEIIPEPENLVFCAKEMTKMQNGSDGTPICKNAILGYMPDCDGDRGNIVYWNENTKQAEVLKAQEVFALSVLAELSFAVYQNGENQKLGVAVNDPTSMRIEEIAQCFNAKVFRAEVGEANVVNLAREKRAEGFTVRILGEGSNGGNITHPAAVRDPLNTLFALLKLLLIKDTPQKAGLFHEWCRRSNQEDKFHDNFNLSDIIDTLPKYTTTGVSEKRAVAAVTQTDHAKLKAAYQKVFEDEWAIKKTELEAKYGFCSFEAICNNGTAETRNVTDYSISKKGGLKILFKDSQNQSLAFLWMRGSGTEPVFRIMCDVKGCKTQEEAELLEWHTQMLLKANELSCR